MMCCCVPRIKIINIVEASRTVINKLCSVYYYSMSSVPIIVSIISGSCLNGIAFIKTCSYL